MSYYHMYRVIDRGCHSITCLRPVFAVTAGALPPGLIVRPSWNNSTCLCGIPTAAGRYTGTVTVTGSYGGHASQSFDILIVDTPPVFPVDGVVALEGSVGAPYSFNVTATGTTPITYKLRSGALPEGLMLDAAGLVSGTPTAMGSFAARVTASNGIPPDATTTVSFVIAGPEPHITSVVPPVGTEGVRYTFNYTATGSTPMTYRVTAGALPPGLTLSASGLIDGTPTTRGTFAGAVTASNGIVPDSTQAFSIPIGGDAPVCSAFPIESLTVGTGISFAFTCTGTAPITYSVSAGALPDGLQLSADGGITGTPTREGTFRGTFTISNGIPPEVTQDFAILIYTPEPPAFTSLPPPGGPVGTPYRFTYTATGSPAISYSVTAGALPPGLSLSVEGVLSGTPTTTGTYTGTVTASSGTPPDVTQDFSITIVEAAPVITSGAAVGGTVGTPYAFIFTATGTAPIAYRITAGALPGGLSLSAAGLINGTPSTAGTFVSTVTASNGIVPNATRNFSITIAGMSPIITSVAPPNGTAGIAYAFSYKATGSAPMVYSVTAGALPSGLTLSGDGLLSGTPTAAGTFMGTVTVSNGALPNTTQDFNITVQGSAVPVDAGSAGGGGGGALDGLSLFVLLLALTLLGAEERRSVARSSTESA